MASDDDGIGRHQQQQLLPWQTPNNFLMIHSSATMTTAQIENHQKRNFSEKDRKQFSKFSLLVLEFTSFWLFLQRMKKNERRDEEARKSDVIITSNIISHFEQEEMNLGCSEELNEVLLVLSLLQSSSPLKETNRKKGLQFRKLPHCLTLFQILMNKSKPEILISF